MYSRSRRLGLETVSRPVFETSRSRLVNFVGTSRLGLVSDIKSNVSVSDMEVSFTVNIMLNFQRLPQVSYNQLSSLFSIYSLKIFTYGISHWLFNRIRNHPFHPIDKLYVCSYVQFHRC